MKQLSAWLRLEAVQISMILITAALLRIAFPGWTEFKADEARLLTLAWDMAEGQSFALRGISSSVGIPNFAASIWVYAVPLAFWKHVYAPTIFTGLLNTAAVGLTYWFVRRTWGRTPALVAALMFAVSPWAIIHSRKIWAQNLLPLFVVLWALSGVKSLIEKRPRWLIVHLLTALFAFQLHFSAVSLLFATAILLIWFWRSLRWSEVGLGIIGGGILSAPFLIYLSRSGQSLSTLLATSTGEQVSGWSWSAFTHTFRLFSGWQIHALAGPNAFQAYLDGVVSSWPAIIFWSLLLLIGLWGLGRGNLPEGPMKPVHERGYRRFMAVWIVVPIVTFLWFPTSVELHYFLPALPVLYIVAGIGFEKLFADSKWWGIGLLLVSSAWQVYVWGALLLFLVTTSTPGGFGEPLRFQLAAVDYTRQLVQSGTIDEVLIAGTGEDPQIDGGAAVYDLHFRQTPHRFVDVTRSAVFPQEDSAVLVVPGRFSLAAAYDQLSSEVQRFPLRPDEGLITVYTLPGGSAPLMSQMLDPQPMLANFVSLLGHDPLNADGRWRILWRVGVPNEVDYHFFNHLQDGFGERIGQADEAAFAAGQWREGDVVLSQFLLSVPVSAQRPFIMRTGMYLYPSLENIPVLDEAANPQTDAVEFLLGP